MQHFKGHEAWIYSVGEYISQEMGKNISCNTTHLKIVENDESWKSRIVKSFEPPKSPDKEDQKF